VATFDPDQNGYVKINPINSTDHSGCSQDELPSSTGADSQRRPTFREVTKHKLAEEALPNSEKLALAGRLEATISAEARRRGSPQSPGATQVGPAAYWPLTVPALGTLEVIRECVIRTVFPDVAKDGGS
jgi:hypothetical protein